MPGPPDEETENTAPSSGPRSIPAIPAVPAGGADDGDLATHSLAGPTEEMGDAASVPVGVGDLAQGSRIGRYVLLDVVGRGGMGNVYRAYDPELDRRVALKLLRSPSGNARERLFREAQALARLAHPNVVAVHDVGVHEGEVFVAMELVEGRALNAWLRDRPRTIREILTVLVPAGRGLAAAHAAGLVHRDVKPGNVLVGNDGRVRVADFGLARSFGDTPAPSDSQSVERSEDGHGSSAASAG